MIDSRELRIGNLLIDSLTGSLLSVSDISETGFTSTVIDRSEFPLPDGWKATPIPLTEEWLLRFAFTRLNHLGNPHFVLTVNDSINIEITISDNTNYSSLCLSNENNDLNIDVAYFSASVFVDLSFVHQLQNLYFSLTGKELINA